MQKFVNKELDVIVSQFDAAIEKNGGIVSPHEFFQLPSLNLTWASVAGFRFDHNDNKIRKLLKLNTQLIKALRVSSNSEAFPILKTVWPSKFGYSRIININHTIQDFVKVFYADINLTGSFSLQYALIRSY